MARSGMAALHLGKGLVHLCSHMSTLSLSLCFMQTAEVMTVWLVLSPLMVVEWIMMKITQTSSAERPDFSDRSLQLAAPGPAYVGGEDSEDVICKFLPHPPSHQFLSLLNVYSHGVKDGCTVREMDPEE